MLETCPATPADAEAIRDLINLAFRAERPFVDGDRIDLAGVRSLFHKGGILLLRDESGVLLGCVYTEARGGRGYIGLLSVDPTHQHAGLGSQLMAAAEQHCRQLGCAAVDLRFINHRTELLRFYSKLGYAESGAVPFPETARMKMPFHFIQMSKSLE
jgi:GNAT superfamily N-acetyltransferase